MRDSQAFVRAAEEGVGICEMQPSRVKQDMEQLDKIISWLDAWPDRHRTSNAATAINRQPLSEQAILHKPQFGSA